MNQEQLTFYVPLGICLVLFTALFLSTPKEEGEPTRWALLLVWLRGYVPQRSAAADTDRVSRDWDAVMENAESGKADGPTPAELDRMIKAASLEAVARAVGTLAGAGFIAPGERSKALLAVGIEGRRYTHLKPMVDAAQAAAQAEAPAEAEPPRAVAVHAGRPDERLVEL